MSYIPTIDEGSCIAQGDCMELLPNVFRVGDRAEVIGEGRRIPIRAGLFEDRFAPYDVHLYRIR